MAHFFDYKRSSIGIDGLVNRDHFTQFHESRDDFRRLHRHLARKFTYRDCFGYLNVVNDPLNGFGELPSRLGYFERSFLVAFAQRSPAT